MNPDSISSGCILRLEESFNEECGGTSSPNARHIRESSRYRHGIDNRIMAKRISKRRADSVSEDSEQSTSNIYEGS